MLWKELRVSLVCSAVLVAVNFIKLLLVDHLLLHNFDAGRVLPEVITVSLTLFATVIVAKIIGCSLPILAKKIGFDPAVMASPFITTIVDAISLLIYFSMAGLLLGI